MKVLALTVFSVLALCGAAHANVSISNKPTQNMSCDAGVCAATAQKAVLNVTDLQNMLASGDVAVKTGSVANDIDIDQPLTWTSTSRLTLDAQRSVVIKRPVLVDGTGAVTILTSDGAVKGELSFIGHGKLNFTNLNGDLIIDGGRYRLASTIADIAELVLQHPKGNVALVSDYDATLDGVYPSSPVATEFAGTFTGLGHTISHLFVSGQGNPETGFFSILETNGVIRSIAIEKSVLAGGEYVGGIVGYSLGLIEEASFDGEVSGETAGGIVAYNRGKASRVRSRTRVRASFGGGVIGKNAGYLDRSFATQTVGGTTGRYVGGLVGTNGGDAGNPCTISNSYALGEAKGGGPVGGLVGYNVPDCVIGTSYSTGKVSVKGGGDLGGIVGYSAGAILSSYWDTDTSGQANGCGEDSCPDVIGLTDAQLKSGLPAGFDPEVWGSNPNINNGYPYLLANPPPK